VNPSPLGLDGFIDFAHRVGSACIEVDWRWLTPLADRDLARVRDALEGVVPIYSYWLAQEPGETLTDPVYRAQGVGASIFRMHLTPVLEGARAGWGQRWPAMVTHARQTLKQEARKVFDAGMILAIENHQDLGSEELLEIVDELGAQAGIVLDTGNPYAVGEDPVAFTRRAAHRIRHVHLKDYQAMFTQEGYRLVRCPIGEGAVPFEEIAEALASHQPTLTASIEPGALEARHIRLFTSEWWKGYPPRDASELGVLLGRLRYACLEEYSDCRTPWERMIGGDELVAYETGQILRSIENLREMGWME
jgi:3-oxoisoapionate decarboxylase